jgi:hypothetical protein
MGPWNQRRRCTTRSRRRGTAPIEFVMWLPLMMFVFWAVLVAGNIFLVNCEVTSDVRQMAWVGRDLPWRGTASTCQEQPLPDLPGAGSKLNAVGKVVDRYFRDNRELPANWKADRGFLTAQHSEDIPFMIDAFAQLNVARSEHAVLAGVWGHHELPFEDVHQKGQHKQLELSKKFRYYTNSGGGLNSSAFTRLKSLGGGGWQQAVNSGWEKCRNIDQRKGDLINGKKREILNGIEKTKKEIGGLQQQLSSLQREEEPDHDTINRTQDQLNREYDRLDDLNDSLQRLKESRDIQNEIKEGQKDSKDRSKEA